MVISTIFLERTCNFFFYDCIVLFVLLPWEILVAFPRESQKQVALTNLVHAGCFSVSIIHQTLTWSFLPESTLCADSYSVSIPPPVLLQWHVKDPGHSANSEGGKLHLNTHTPLTQ